MRIHPPRPLVRLHRAIVLILVLLTFFLAARIIAAEDDEIAWRSLGGPVAFATLMAADPDNPDYLVAFIAQSASRNNDYTQASQGYLRQAWAPYFSADGGRAWQPASNDLAAVEPTALLITTGKSSPMLWVGTAGDGLWQSENSGRTWRPVPVSGLENQRVVALAVDPRRRIHLLALDNARYPSSYLYTSDELGAAWSKRLLQPYTGRPNSYVIDLLADPIVNNRLYAVTYGGLLLTDDGGQTWRPAPLPVSDGSNLGGETALAVDPTQRGRLHLITQSTGLTGETQANVYRSLDSGETWETLPAVFRTSTGAAPLTSVRPLRLQLDPLDRQRMLLAANNGLWVSTDYGLTWQTAGETMDGPTIVDVLVHPYLRGQWVAIGAGGIWRTANAGAQWQAMTTGLPPNSRLQSILKLDDAAGPLLALNSGVMPIPTGTQPLWRSVDGGQSWMPAMRGLGGNQLIYLAKRPDSSAVIYGVGFSGLARSSDNGRTWRYTPLPFSPRQIAFGDDPQHMYLSSYSGLWLSTDNGDNWSSVITDTVQAVATSTNGDIYAVVGLDEKRQLQRSTDDGGTWETMGPPPIGEINTLLVQPSSREHLLLSVFWHGLWASSDGGRTWQRRDKGIPAGTRWIGPEPKTPDGPNLLAIFIDPNHPSTWWASRDGGGVYRSQNNGLTWSDASVDLGDNLILSFSQGAEGILAGTANLGLIQNVDTTTGQSPPPAVDARIEILWPHDFAPVTTAQKANLGLRLYASRSQEVPPCPWTPNVEVWMARNAEPMRRLGLATQRTVEGHPFPFWELNDVDVSWANEPGHSLTFMAQAAPGQAESASSVWIHTADVRTYLPQPPTPTGLTTEPPAAIDAVIRVVWPHDQMGNALPSSQASLVNISAVLFARDSLLTLAPEHLPRTPVVDRSARQSGGATTRGRRTAHRPGRWV